MMMIRGHDLIFLLIVVVKKSLRWFRKQKKQISVWDMIIIDINIINYNYSGYGIQSEWMSVRERHTHTHKPKKNDFVLQASKQAGDEELAILMITELLAGNSLFFIQKEGIISVWANLIIEPKKTKHKIELKAFTI